MSILTLTNLRGNNSGLIDCAAITDVDVKLAGIELLVRGSPSSDIKILILKPCCRYP